MDLWKSFEKNMMKSLYIPMSSGLSSSCDTAMDLLRNLKEKSV